MYEFIRQAFQLIVDAVMPIVKYLWSQIEVIINTSIGVIMGIIKVFTGLFTGDFSKMKEGALDIFGALWGGVKGLVSNAWGMLSGAFSTLWGKISGWFGDLKGDALRWGKNMISGFIDGIKAKATAVKDAALGVMGGIGKFLGFNSPAEEGPGRNIVKWGANMIDGFLDGVNSQKRTAGESMSDVVKNMSSETAMPVRNISNNENDSKMRDLLDLLREFVNRGSENMQIILDTGILAGELTPRIDRNLGSKADLESRGRSS
jgi:phage-related protein